MKIAGYRNKIANQLKIENVFSAVSDDFLGMIKLFLNDKGTADDTSIHVYKRTEEREFMYYLSIALVNVKNAWAVAVS